MWLGCGVALASTVFISLDSVDPSKVASATGIISSGNSLSLPLLFPPPPPPPPPDSVLNVYIKSMSVSLFAICNQALIN
jgi:hypothetical protein